MPTTFEKPWFLDPNRPHPGASTSILDQGKAQFWYWKAFLKGDVGGAMLGRWNTVIGSSDAVTAALDGVDRLIGAGGPAVYDGTKIIRGVSGANSVPSSTAATTGGTLATGTYYFAVFPITENGILGNPYYEKSQAVTGPAGTATVTWIAVPGTQTTTGYRIYVGTAASGENTYFTVPAGTLTFTYTGQAGTAGALPTAVFTNVTAPVGYLTSFAPHSWITLQGPDITAGGLTNTPFYVTFDYGAGNWEYLVNVYFSKTRPTGGTIYARPTAPDEFGWAQASFVNSVAGSSPKLDGWLAADGTFAFGAVNPGANAIQGGFAFVPLADARPDDLCPVFAFLNWSASVYTTVKNSNSWQGRTKDNSSGVIASMAWLAGYADPVTTFPNTGDAGDLGFYELATYIITSQAPYSIRGRVADLVAAVPGIAGVQGYTEPADGPPTSEILGYLWFPLPGGVAVTL